MPTTAVLLIPYPTGTDDPDVPGDISALAARIETLFGGNVTLYGTLTIPGDASVNGGTIHLNGPTIGKGGLGELSYRTGSSGGGSAHVFRSTGSSGTADGDVYGLIHDVSDERMKEGITTIEDALETVRALRGTEYDWIDSGQAGGGVIAQEVQAVYPRAVSAADQDDESSLGVNPTALIGLLIEATKTLAAQVEELQSRLPA